MKLSHLLLTTSLCAVAAGPVLAQSRTFSSIDTNRDDRLSISELEAAFGKRGADRIMSRSDLDGDGLVSASEVQVSQDDERDDERDDDERDDERDDDERDDESDDDERDDERDDDERDDERDDDESDDEDDD